MTDNARGAGLMCLAMAAFTASDSVMKLIGQAVPLFQAVFLRGLVVSAMLFVIAWRSGALGVTLLTSDRVLLMLRVVAEIAVAVFFFVALFNMPLPNVIAVFQAAPLLLVAAGALFLGEKVGWRRWSLIALGLLVVLCIIRPGTEGFDFYSLFALASVLSVVLRDLATRRMSKTVPSLLVAFWSATGVTVFAGVGSLGETWVSISALLALEIGAAAVFILGGYLFTVLAVRQGELAVVTPFRYTSMLWALLVGVLVFGEWPDMLTLVGAGLVVVAGLLTLWRERLLAQAPHEPARPAPRGEV